MSVSVHWRWGEERGGRPPIEIVTPKEEVHEEDLEFGNFTTACLKSI
jgi:hypothetical protein